MRTNQLNFCTPTVSRCGVWTPGALIFLSQGHGHTPQQGEGHLFPVLFLRILLKSMFLVLCYNLDSNLLSVHLSEQECIPVGCVPSAH